MSFEDQLRTQIHAAGGAIPGEPLGWDETIARARSARRTHLIVAVAAATAAAVIIGAGAGVALIRADGPLTPPAGNGGSAGDGSPSPRLSPETAEAPAESPAPEVSSPTEGPRPSCSAAVLDSAAIDLEGITPEADSMRHAIITGALACDLEALETLARGEGFAASVVGGRPAEVWRSDEKAGFDPLKKLVLLLNTPYVTETYAGKRHYVWPTVQGKTKPTDGDWAILVVNGIYTRKEVDAFKAAGLYLGYRLSISDDGDWEYYTAGD